MQAFLAVVKKELGAVLRERTILIAVLIQLFIASFSSALLVGLLSLYDADSAGLYASYSIHVGVLGPRPEVLDAALEERGVAVTPFEQLPEAREAFFRGQVQAILVLPEEGGTPQEVRLYLPHSEAAAALILNYLQEPLKRYENALRQAEGIPVRYTDLGGIPPTTFEFLYAVILPILMFFPAFVAGGMVIDSLSEEIENHTLDTLLSAPLSLRTAVEAKITAALLLALVQCLAWLGLLWINGVRIHNPGLVLLLALVTAGMVTLGSAVVTVLLRDRERSQFVFSLALLVLASASFFTDLSPIKMLARLATGDYYTGGQDVLVLLCGVGLFYLLFRTVTRQVRA
ncbi:MAG: ABC transporter permease [Anaerolineaceae bacterium]|nr:ABC transporter permease [Anaerolineaceae bacterium]